MTIAQLVVAAAILVSVPFALRATWRLWALYRADLRRSLILRAIALVSTIVTGAAVWIGILSVRRMLGYDPLDWTAPITGLVVVAVLQVPMILDSLVSRVGKHRSEPDNIGKGPSA